MTPSYQFESGLYFDSEKTFYSFAIVISELECVLAVGNEDAALVYLANYKKPDDVSQVDFLDKILNENQALLTQVYHQVTVGVQTNYFTLVPDELELQGDDLVEFLKGNKADQSEREVLVDDVEFLDATMCYAIPKDLFSLIENYFESFDIQLCTTNALEIARELTQFDSYVCIDRSEFDLVCKQRGQIVSVSRQKYESNDDILYFILLALKDAAIDPQQAKVALSGYCQTSGELKDLLNEFIGTVTIQLFEDGIRIPNEFDQPKQFYQNVLNLLHAGY